ncbi:hypothetical protein LCGC14_3136120 [marine sediment metagenome]|uniref:Uncharacterized protein n=1 Tax=marine sediment metagenome TaxID=412755 RepID=A0A0F8Y591_9ZZZZ
MSNKREEINAILDEVENKAYRRGWEEAVKEIKDLALQRLANRQQAVELEETENYNERWREGDQGEGQV